MRIAIIADVLDRNNAGISQYARQLIMHLKRWHELTVVHVKKSDDPVFEGTREIIVPRFFSSPSLLRLFVNLFLRNLDVDIIHHPSTLGAFALPMRQKLVQTVFDVIPLKLPKTRTWWNGFLYRFLAKPSIRNADAIITISNNSKKDICEMLHVPEEKIFITPLASMYSVPTRADVEKVQKRHGISYPYFIYVGTFEPRKNIVRMLDAFALSGLPHHFLLVGSRGWKDEHVFRKAAGMKNVHVLSGVPNEDLPALYAGAAALVYVSLYEGFGLPVVEAMSCGCPVISSCTSSLPEVGGSAALYVDPYHVGCIARAMKMAVKRRAVLSKKGQRQAKKFSWERTARLTEQVYRSLYRNQ
ncbi:MAG: glycosyltransferase family 1 protein [Candidatus Woesearchaeota archaeon]